MKLKDLKKIEGTSHYNKWYEKYTIIQVLARNNILIQFEDSNFLIKVKDKNLIKGDMSNPNRITTCGVGFTGYGEHKINENGVKTKAYIKWQAMLDRVYGVTNREKKCYVGCSVDEHWFNFQNFAKWFYKEIPKIQGYTGKVCLDQDLLTVGNTVYSPENCCLIPYELNIAIKLAKTIYHDKRKNTFNMTMTKTYDSDRGLTFTAHSKNKEKCIESYSKAKDEYIKQLGIKYKNFLSEKVFLACSNFNTKSRFLLQYKGTNETFI